MRFRRRSALTVGGGRAPLPPLLPLAQALRDERGGGDQCEGDGDGACRAARGWDSLSPRDRRRGDALARYLAALPTVAMRRGVGLAGWAGWARWAGDGGSAPTPVARNPHTHPLFWPSRVLRDLFPPGTHTYRLVRDGQAMVEGEFEALGRRSGEFRERVTYLEYLNARINVLSRVFGVPASADDRGARWGAARDDDGEERRSLAEELRCAGRVASSTTPRTIIMIISINIISTSSLLLLLLLVLLLLLFLIVYHWDFPRARCQGARRGHLPPPLISGWLCCSWAPAGAPVGAPAIHYNLMGLRRDRRRIQTLEGGG